MDAVTAALLVCQVHMELPQAGLAADANGPRTVYRVDHRQGPVKLLVEQPGLFATQAQFTRFHCEMLLEHGDPLSVRLDLALDLRSVQMHASRTVAMPFRRGVNVTAHPLVRFRSSAVAAPEGARHLVRGLLEVAGVTRLQALELAPPARRREPITGTDVAELVFTGRFSQASFGIALRDIFLADVLELKLTAPIELVSAD